MCGIVGYVGGRPCRELLVAGLEKLEYRGYDSAGVSVIEDGEVDSVRAVGNLANLRAAVERARRATAASRSPRHRRPPASPTPAGPPTAGSPRRTPTPTATAPTASTSSSTGSSRTTPSLRRGWQAEGQDFSSETDAEVVAHLIADHYDGDLAAAVRAAFAELRGHYAFVAMHADEPGAPGRRPQGVPTGRRHRRGRDLPRLGDPGLPRRDPRRGADRERRDGRRSNAGGVTDHRRRGQPDRARARRGRPGTPTPPRRAATRPSC